MSRITREIFARKLCSLFDVFEMPNFDVQAFGDQVMQAFLEFGSDTPDNRMCWERIEFGSVEEDGPPWIPSVSYVFKVKNKSIYVRDILNRMEELPIPSEIAEAYPELDEEEWSAIMRIALMIVTVFEPTKPLE